MHLFTAAIDQTHSTYLQRYILANCLSAALTCVVTKPPSMDRTLLLLMSSRAVTTHDVHALSGHGEYEASLWKSVTGARAAIYQIVEGILIKASRTQHILMHAGRLKPGAHTRIIGQNWGLIQPSKESVGSPNHESVEASQD